MIFSYFTQTPYIAVIGDLKQSRQITNRSDIQVRLKAALNQANHRYRDEIAAGFLITLGDEFQGLLFHGGHLMHILHEIQQSIYPVKLRFGLGIGPITTEIDTTMALGADGPGYYAARKAINTLKENEKKNQVAQSDIWIETDSLLSEQMRLLNATLALMYAIRETWSESQYKSIWAMFNAQETHKGQKEAAAMLGIAQPTLQRALTRGNYYTYKEAADTIEDILKGIRPSL